MAGDAPEVNFDMRGPDILARTISRPTRRGRSSVAWQYHSRSDNHSKVACWSVLFDLLLECDALRRDAAAGRVGFGINHVMVGPINKTLDLVITLMPPARVERSRATFARLVDDLGIVLADEDRVALEGLPVLMQDRVDDISEVAVALEAKACMTEHVKSLPRLHAEILATGYLAKKAAPRCISVSYSLINAATTFVTPSEEGRRNSHNQPEDALRVADMIRTAVPTVSDARDYGYDVVGVTVLKCCNDGSTVEVVRDPAVAPAANDRVHYERMVRALCSEYRARFFR